MQELLVLAELPDELLDAEFIEVLLVLRRIRALVGEIDLKPGVKKGQLAQSRGELRELELGGDVEDGRIGQKRDERAGVLLVLQIADDRELLRGDTTRECHVIDLAVARHLHLEPVGKRVHAFRPDAVQPSGKFVGALAELSARVQIRQHQLDRRHLELGMDIHRNASPVVLDRARSIDMQGDIDA